MSRKLLRAALLACAIFVCAFALAACSSSNPAPAARVADVHLAPAVKAPACNATQTVCVANQPPSLSLIQRQGATSFGLDHAWGSLSVGTLHSWGAQFVLGYLSYDGSKNLSGPEIAADSRAGIPVGLVWETSANRALDGYAAGRSDAFAALAQANSRGEPSWAPIYFAVDFDTSGAVGQIFPYFQGARSVLGQRTGDYGGLATVQGLANAHLASHHWQTLAWSYGRWDPRACVRQYAIDRFVGGVGVDYNQAVCDWGGWRVGQANPAAPKPKPIAFDFWQRCSRLDAIHYWKAHGGHGHVSRAQHLQAVRIRKWLGLRRNNIGCSASPHSYPYRLPHRAGALA